MNNRKNKLTKILALGATSAALFAGVAAMNNDQVQADSTTLLKFKHNAYQYNSKGKRVNKKIIKKGAKYYYTKSIKINGKKYYKLDTKGNVYVKKGNVSVTTISKTVTLKHNAYQYNSKGKRVKSAGVLKKGDSYFVWGTKYINGKKYYRVDNNLYIKASNVASKKKTTASNNSSATTTTVNTSQFSNSSASANIGASQVVNNQATNNSSSSAQQNNNQSSNSSNSNITQIKPNTNSSSSNTSQSQSQQNNSSHTTKPSTDTKPSDNKQDNKPSQPTQPTQPAKTYSENKLIIPQGYIQALKSSNFTLNPTIKKLAMDGINTNVFHSESAADDNMKISSGNLTSAQALEINNFALRLINQARAAYGSKDWYYTTASQHVADRVAYLYAQDNMGIGTWHDQKALNQVDKEFGISTAELMGGGSVYYTSDEINTMSDLKRAVMNDITAMLFSTNELEHAQIMLTWNTTSKRDYTSFGLSVSWRANDGAGHKEYSTHFIAF